MNSPDDPTKKPSAEAQTAHEARVAALNAALAEGEQSGPAALFEFDRILNRTGGQPPQPGDELLDEN